jgi:N-glycosylase/DNA lyase
MTLERYGVRGSEADGVFFTETAAIEGARVLGEVEVKIGGQNKDIRDIKRELAKRVIAKGGNALVAFRYGQQGNSWWQSFGLFDSEHWYGSGIAVTARDI